MDWTPVAAAAVGAIAAIVGGFGTAVLAARASMRQLQRDQEREEQRERRQAFLELFVIIDDIRAMTDGISEFGGSEPKRGAELRREATRATETARFHASEEGWAEMAPLVEAATLRANWSAARHHRALTPELSTEIAQRMAALGAEDEEGWSKLVRRFLDGAWADARRPL